MASLEAQSKESTCQGRRHRFDPWFGKIPQAPGQLSLCPTAIEPMPESPGTEIFEPAPQL